MPTYPYACTACDNRFEIVQAFTDDALSVCARCNGRLRKVFSSVGVVFKGSGFYRNDSRSTGSTPVSSGISADTGSSGAGSGGSGESSTPKKSDAPASTGTSAPAVSSTSSSGSAKDTSSAA